MGTEIFTCPELHARVAVVEKIISVAEVRCFSFPFLGIF